MASLMSLLISEIPKTVGLTLISAVLDYFYMSPLPTTMTREWTYTPLGKSLFTPLIPKAMNVVLLVDFYYFYKSPLFHSHL